MLFLVLSFIAVFPLWRTGYLFSGPDMQFHLSRIQELVDDIKQGGLFAHPIIATHTFNQIGDAAPSMYPGITIYLFAFLMFIFKPIDAIYTGFVILIFLTLLIAYFCAKVIVHSRKLSLCYALLYGYGAFFLNQITYLQLGTVLAYPFIPVVLIGTYLILHNNYQKWYILSLGLVGLLYSHVLSAFLVIVTLIIYLLCHFVNGLLKKSLKIIGHQFISFLLSGLVALCLSVNIWLPIFLDIRYPLVPPIPQGVQGNKIIDIFTLPFQDNGFNDGMGILILLVLLFTLIIWNFLPPKIHKFYYISLILLWATSTLFPWNTLSKLFKILNNIQKANRLMPLIIALLSLCGVYVFLFIFKHILPNKVYIPVILLILISVFFALSDQHSALYTQNNFVHSPYITEPVLNYKANYAHQVPNIVSGGGYRVNNLMYDNQFPELNETGMRDYTPKQINSNEFGNIALRNVHLGNNKKYYIGTESLHSKVNGLRYHLNWTMYKNERMMLPFINYKSLIYNVTFNGKPLKCYKNSKELIEIKVPKYVNAHKGANISITCSQPYHVVIAWISLLTWIGLLIFIFRRTLKDHFISE